MIVICDHDNLDAWLALRTALWPSSSPEDHRAEMREILASPHHSAFMARGWTALSLALPRSRCATITSTAANRRRWRFGRDLYRRGRPPPGLGRALNRTGAGVGEAAGAASWRRIPTSPIDSQRLHAALGFAETERVVFYRKTLG